MAGRIIYPLIGWVYLLIRYRTREKANQILQSRYDNRYFNVGAEKTLTFIAIVFLLLILFLIGSVIYSTIKFGPS